MGDTYLSRASDVGDGGTEYGTRINPATEERQADSLSTKSVGGGSQRVTLSGGVAQATAQACKFCRVQANSGNSEVVRVRIGSAAGAATGVELPDSPVLTPYSVSNLSLLYFYSVDANAIVDIEYFD